MPSAKSYIICSVVIVIIAVSIGLIASSLKRLETEQAGLQYNVVENKLKDQVYLTGLHAGPPGYKFIIFPRVYNTINFPAVKCLNKDGLTIKLDVAFQYLVSLANKDLYTVVKQFRDHDNYREVIKDAAQVVIHDVCSEFDVTQFQTSRNQFQSRILVELQKKLSKDFKTNVRDVQVSDIVRPKQYEEVVKRKEAAKQNIFVALQERPRIITAAETKIKEAKTQANITVETAKTEARITLAKADAEAEAILNAYKIEAETYKTIMKDQNLSVPGLLSYITTRALEAAKNPVKININAPAKTTFP